MKIKLQDQETRERWESMAEPGGHLTDEAFARYQQIYGQKHAVLNCAIPRLRAQSLTDFAMPSGWNVNQCMVTSGGGKFPPGLADWKYQPRISAERQLPQMRPLDPQQAKLEGSPWFQSPSQAVWFGINARNLRYHHALWQELRPKVLRGVHTTLVFVTPQIGFSLTPHIDLTDAFLYFASLARAFAPIQLFPAKYLFPDARLGCDRDTPAPIFADLLPATGGYAFPVMEWTPDPWGTLARFDMSERYYGYPFSRAKDPTDDFSLSNYEGGSMILPNGRLAQARESASYVYGTLDGTLRQELMLSREQFEENRCLVRGTITHDSLPFMLPVELQTMIHSVMLTGWELEMDKPGDLSSYVLRTRHAAIRGYNYFQRIEPCFSSFMRLIQDLAKDSSFGTFPLATHLTHSWLGGNLRVPSQRSSSELEIGADLMRNYYQQQLDWMAGVFNLWNHIGWRRQGVNLQDRLGSEGLAFHQMRRMLRFDSHLFPRPEQRASFWPNVHPGWSEYDRTNHINSLPRI